MSKRYNNDENIFDYLQCHKNQQKVLKEQAEKKKGRCFGDIDYKLRIFAPIEIMVNIQIGIFEFTKQMTPRAIQARILFGTGLRNHFSQY